MEAKMEGYTSLEDIKTFAAIAEARLGAMISKLLTDNRVSHDYMTKASLLLMAAVCLTMIAHADMVKNYVDGTI